MGPPLTYMEECGVFKPLETIDNPIGLCRFYRMSSKKSNVLTGPKSADCAHKIHDMIKLAKGVRQLLTVIVFKGETVTPLGLLQELHLCLTLSHVAIHTLEEVKVGPKNHMSCCPICTYVVKNDYSFLNHIIIGYYWSSFSCRKMPEVHGIKQAANEETHPRLWEAQEGVHEKAFQRQQGAESAKQS